MLGCIAGGVARCTEHLIESYPLKAGFEYVRGESVLINQKVRYAHKGLQRLY